MANAAIPSSATDSANLKSEMYIADGDYIKDIEVNDLRNRYTLTKGSTQKMVNNSNPLILLGLSAVVYKVFCLVLLIIFLVIVDFKTCEAHIADTVLLLSLVFANLECVHYRLRMKLAPVRIT